MTELALSNNTPLPPPGLVSLQYLTFTVGNDEYGVDIMMVREVKGWSETTRLPNSPDYVRGVLNLRGVIIPIFDLRARFGQGNTEADSKNVIVIVALEEKTIGILVDAVSDILSVSSGDIKAAPNEGAPQEKFINGLIAVEDRMVVLLDAETLFGTQADALGTELSSSTPTESQ